MKSSGDYAGATVTGDLGKPSFRRRLEGYYSVVAPDVIQRVDWPSRFQHIWDKYGGTYEGETRLSANLSKKYGDIVGFDTAVPANKQVKKTVPTLQERQEISLMSERSFDLDDGQRGSLILDLLSFGFDPFAVLRAPLDEISQANPWMQESNSFLDRVELFSSYLPKSDPLHIPKSMKETRRHQSVKGKEQHKPLSALAKLAAPLASGPYSLLYKSLTERQRVRILTRYDKCIRGTLTGYVIGFDKYMNVLIRDVDEAYTSPCVDHDEATSLRLETEVRRRVRLITGLETPQQIFFKQMLVRGDNIVCIYLAEQERSAWPLTSKSPDDTIYRARTVRKLLPPCERIGTPGSWLYTSQRDLKSI